MTRHLKETGCTWQEFSCWFHSLNYCRSVRGFHIWHRGSVHNRTVYRKVNSNWLLCVIALTWICCSCPSDRWATPEPKHFAQDWVALASYSQQPVRFMFKETLSFSSVTVESEDLRCGHVWDIFQFLIMFLLSVWLKHSLSWFRYQRPNNAPSMRFAS